MKELRGHQRSHADDALQESMQRRELSILLDLGQDQQVESLDHRLQCALRLEADGSQLGHG